MTGDPAVSVIVPTFNRPQYLLQTLLSLTTQRGYDFEVIVVNDGGAAIDSVVCDERLKDLRLRTVEGSTNRGVSAARNEGLRESRGTYVAFLDDDDVVLPGHLAASVSYLRRHELDLVYTSAVVATQRFDTSPDLSFYVRKDYAFSDEFLAVANFIHTGAVVTRNPARVGAFFDVGLTVCEDWDMWLRLTRTHSFKAGHIDIVTAVYHQIPSITGAVALGQNQTPSPFAVARRSVYSRWSAQTASAHALRAWMQDFDEACDAVVQSGEIVPVGAFDNALKHIKECLTRRIRPNVDVARQCIADAIVH